MSYRPLHPPPLKKRSLSAITKDGEKEGRRSGREAGRRVEEAGVRGGGE